MVPSPSYPIHIYAPVLAGADVNRVAMGPAEDLFGNLVEAFERSWPRPRVIILSFPHNPTTATVDLEFMQRAVDFAREHEVLSFTTSPMRTSASTGTTRRRSSRSRAPTEVAVELYTLTKSFSMAGWRVGFLVGDADVVQALARLKSYLDYGTFQPIQIASIVAMNEAPDYPEVVRDIYRSRRDALCDGLARRGWEFPKAAGDDVRLGADPRGLPRARLARVRGQADRRRRRWPSARASASAPAARASSASRSSRTRHGSARRCADQRVLAAGQRR